MNEFKGFEDLHELPPESECVGGKPSQFSEDIGGIEVPGFTENCPKCAGTGNWRPGFTCFKCKGKGKLTFKTSPEARGKARKYAAKSKAKRATETKAIFEGWLKNNPAINEWFREGCFAGNDFAISLYENGLKYGQLTEGQERAVLNSIAELEDSKTEFEEWCEAYPGVMDWLKSEVDSGNEFAGSLLSYGKRRGHLSSAQLNSVLDSLKEGKSTQDETSDIDLSCLKGHYAVPDGDTRLKLCVRKPGKNSRWRGWIFVDDGAAYGSRRTYGKQAPDGLYQGSVQDQLRAILADPFEAQVAYGKLTGSCGMCGRILEDEESVAAGIGPICAAKYA